ncbi:3-oxoacyl-ACP synthase III family protein [Burkholderia cepacia]|uniref:3-oxoacyl-ACP synthase III family protein n=1 Tax=Burkholderia cepacia TaxID=292 RepID=UPI001CF345E3|nr:ketoacyl-ACP synthase III [Burkholderia cepacia]MCA8350731.1 ketoacyl-ACP synthase III [Burkholderia cepacia]
MNGNVVILGLGRYLPETVVTNADIAAHADTSAAWIRHNTGIEERRFCDETESQHLMGAAAAQEALDQAGVRADEVDVILVTTNVPDYPIPATACLIQKELGAVNASGTDLITACPGFPVATAMAQAYIQSGLARYVLVVATECLSRLTDPVERTIYSILGDGAGALLFGPMLDRHGIVSTFNRTAGEHWDVIHIPVGGTFERPTARALDEKRHVVKMDGRRLKKLFEHYFPKAINGVLEKAGLTLSDIDWLVPHQANLRLIEAAAKTMNFPQEKVVANIQKYGNTSSASIPIALYDLAKSGQLKRGDLLLMPAFGSGFSYGAVVYRW